MDIRKYFSPIATKKKPVGSSQPNKEAKKKVFVIDSDDEEEPPKVSKRQKIEDSDDEMFEVTSKRKLEAKKEEKSKSDKRKSLSKPKSPKLKPVAVADFFGSAPVACKKKHPLGEKEEEEEVVIDSDDGFEETLAQLDEEDKKTKLTESRAKLPHSSPANEVKPKSSVNSPPNKIKPEEKEMKLSEKEVRLVEMQAKASQPLSCTSKMMLSSKLKAFEFEKRKSGDLKSSNDNREEEGELMHKDKRIKHEDMERGEARKEHTLKKDKNGDREKDKHRDEDQLERDRKPHQTQNGENHTVPNNSSKGSLDKKPHSHTSSKIKEQGDGEKVTPKNESKIKEGEDGKEVAPKKENKEIPGKEKGNIKKETQHGTPGNGEQRKKGDDSESTLQEEKKKNAREAYFKFLKRTGPANPGSKSIPEGEPGCLQGLVFVLSGVFESLDREEAEDLIRKYGGKATKAVSRKTSYLVLGSEAGESKLKKAEQLGTKQLDEDGLLDLIRTLPGKGPKEDTKKGSFGKASDKLKAFAREDKKEGSGGESQKGNERMAAAPSNTTTPTSTPSPKRSLLLHTSSPASQGSNCSPSSWSGSSSPSTQPLSSQEVSERPGDILMWVDKYKPASIKNIIGQQGDRSNVKKLLNWLKNWNTNQLRDKKPPRPSPWAKDDNGAFFKAALLSGPPGVGKTTSAHLVCKELGYDVVELNASDARSKRTLDEMVSELLTNKVLAGYATSSSTHRTTSSHHVLLMDEVDGMSGNEDRGGVQELITLIKKSHVPIITMCNDRNHPKIRSLANHCFDLRFPKPRVEQIRGPMMSICFREGIKLKPDALDQIIVGANQDVRQILHHLSLWSATEKNLQAEDMKREAERAKKDLKKGPWDVCRAVFTYSVHKDMNIHEKSDLFFHDYSIAPLFVQENYPKVNPRSAGGKRVATLEQLAKTAKSLADGDLVEKLIRSGNAWSLLPTQAMFSSVLPGTYMSGHLSAQIEFPRWLGNNSRRNKFDRSMQELQMHMRLKISGDKLDVGMDYSGALRNSVTRPLVRQGGDGVGEAVEVMTEYHLLREDLDTLLELSTWPGTKDPMASVESKVKAAFTRTFNKEIHMTPFAAPSITKKKKVKMGEDAYGEEEEEDDNEEEDITASGMIKQKKGGAKKDGETSRGKGSGGSSKGGGSAGKGRGGGGGKERGKK